jgi:predicted RNA-binding Zn-ribbon protein involved in translation (DUF1610 family)
MTEELRLDGNAFAGLFVEVFGAEMTTAERGCASCGQRRALGAHLAYRGAGVVLRCPGCGDMAMLIAELPDRYVVRLTGSWAFSAPRAG